jgi:concanavalin A-like lectin/glucanase superfamily protein
VSPRRPIGACAALAGLLALAPGCSAGGSSTAAIPSGTSLRFDGVDDWVELGRLGPGHPLLLAARPFTISAWFLEEEGGDRYARLIDRSDGPGGLNGWGLGVDAQDGAAHFYVHDGARGADFVSSRGALPPGVRHHLVAVAHAGSLELWVDGRRDHGTWYESGAPALPSALPGRARIGNWTHDTGRAWKGVIDDIAVWSVDLPDAAIVDLHAAHASRDLDRAWGRYAQADWLVGWWRMGDGDPPAGARDRTAVLRDSSPTGTHGALRPAPPFGAPAMFVPTQPR